MGHAHLLRYQCETSDLNLKDAAQVHVIRLLILPTGTIYSTTTIQLQIISEMETFQL